MVIDTSAVMAILLAEPTAERLSRAIRAAPTRRMSAASLVEAGIVVQGRFLRSEGDEKLDRLVAHLEVEVLPFTERHAGIARDAFRRFGKGRHPAGLNFGDCFSYALSQALGEPLLFVGEDFTRTDVKVAAY